MSIKELFEAFSDPVRLRIIELFRERDWTPSQLSDVLELSRPAVTHHLNILRRAGVISCVKRGKKVICSLELTVFQEIIKFASGYLKEGKNEN